MGDTIFALSSGAPPAAIAVLRVSGEGAGAALKALCGRMPEPRTPSLRRLRDRAGNVLDQALVLWFPGQRTATGEDLVELHCHGGRAVVRAMEGALGDMPGLRRAEAGEFTRRAFANGRIDLAEAEGLADLLAAETELQRLAAQAAFGGSTSRMVEDWRDRILALSAEIEAALDFSDEDDVSGLSEAFGSRLTALCGELEEALAKPPAERLRQGIRVVLAGPPNSGKSSLFNALLRDGAAIVSNIAGTTRDAIERPIAFSGIPFVLIDTAGLRDEGFDSIEGEGIGRARSQIERADIVLWLGPEGQGPNGSLEIQTKADLEHDCKLTADHVVSSVTGEGLRSLELDLVERSRKLLPRTGEAALAQRQRDLIGHSHEELLQALGESDLLIKAEGLRQARVAFDRLLGKASTEEMLDALFGRFCIGK
ncbi:tRNA uridine-5-carboxymethylaminomethyl(34) synthesis GTPase MnmE [Qipengyuania spongiae]|uniref:tRNA modification GTPase MnmE n=1 Tax=Qipengyuania spongiae TaxID=2909673 RepID=A0ABY5T0P6_9SPHN|nr:tRNA uridine-5-carboxymethylaminomethyl(34) synthesis GTPase MnmE [Qipengyuania spongiae]UVI39980.1 tRNA uridine-5-carboxymethylaminomethyl(34) synthesis GTPase MnmE [Qipengyuania spongiae]